jgi:hypothetical protein
MALEGIFGHLTWWIGILGHLVKAMAFNVQHKIPKALNSLKFKFSLFRWNTLNLVLLIGKTLQ